MARIAKCLVPIVLAMLCTFLCQSTHANQFFLSGSVSGLEPGKSLTINDNGGPITAYPVTENGSFTYGPVPNAYNITAIPPPGEECNVANGVGQLTGNVNNIWISCQPSNFVPPPSRWTPLVRRAPGNIGTMLLLSDASVIMNNGNSSQGTTWYRLSPDADGHYVNGTWSTIKSSNCPHEEYASQILTDGRVFVAGGEYPNPPSGIAGCSGPGESNTGVDTEIYDPAVNLWTQADPPITLINPKQPANNYHALCGQQAFVDMISATLPDGSVLMSPVCPMNCGDTLRFDPKSFSPGVSGSGWSFGGTLVNTGGTALSCSEQEASWVKLRDGSILTADPLKQPGATQTSERYIPSLQRWVQDSPPGFPLFDSEFGYNGDGEEGPGFLIENGNAVFIGGGTTFGVYTPTPQTPATSLPLPGIWTGNPLSPTGSATEGAALSADDAPGAMMADGRILLSLNFAATASNFLPTPMFFYEYDPVANTFSEVAGPGNPGAPSVWSDCGATVMLDLPDGTVLMPSGCDNTQLYVYQPTSAPLSLGQPTIRSVTKNANGSYHLTGTGLNGISEGAAFGDDGQMASNYPLVRLTNITTGDVAYARTYNWSSTVPVPGAAGTTDFALPPGAHGDYTLQVVVNGNASAGTPFAVECPAKSLWSATIAACVPILECPSNCRNGCIYQFPKAGEQPTLVCRGGIPLITRPLQHFGG